MAGSKEPSPGVHDSERELTAVTLRTVVALLKGSVRNAGKDCACPALPACSKTRLFSGSLCAGYRHAKDLFKY